MNEVNLELPHITKSTYGSSSALMGANKLLMGAQGLVDPERNFWGNEISRQIDQAAKLEANPQNHRAVAVGAYQPKEKKPMPTARIVRVFIADTNENIPLEKRIIYKSDEKLTDLTDQELFFEANPAALLADHNAFRTTVVDKAMTTARGKEVFLEPARIRDLRMVVVDVAAF